MNGAVWAEASHLPSVRHFFDQITQDLSDGRSVIVLLPLQLSADDVWSQVYRTLFEKDFLCEELDVFAQESVPSSLEGLVDLIGHYPTGRGSAIEAKLSDPNFPDITLLRGLGEVSEDKRKAWLRLVSRWSDLIRSAVLSQTGIRRLCVIDAGANLLRCLPATDVYLSHRWWWGFPSALELRLICRELGDTSDPATWWQECLISGVAPGDLHLASALWEQFPQSLKEVVEVIACSGRNPSGYDLASQTVPRMNRHIPKNVGVEPPTSIRGLWAEGAVVSSVEYGVEAHPSALVQHDHIDELEHRLWRGQTPHLLPWADQVRLRACADLTRVYGKSWSTRWFPPNSLEDQTRLRESPLDAELGYLVTLTSVVDELKRRPWKSALEHSWIVRNQLAHYQPVDWKTFRSFWEEATRNGL